MAAKIKFKNLDKFKIDLSKFNNLTEEQHSQLLRKVAFQVLRGVVEKTPVDTGRARGNWQVVVNAAAGTATVNNDDTSGTVTIAQGFEALADVPPFSTIVIYNNVEYIVFLESGSSRQAPAGMVAITIAEVEGQFR